MKKLTKQEVNDILLGAAIVGTGGGGSLDEGLKIVDKAFKEGCEFMLADIDDVEDEALVGTPYGCGSISPLSDDQQRQFENAEKIETTAEVAAVQAIQDYFGQEFYGVLATELGGMNTAVALDAAARIGKPIIDADPAGRSVPCLQHTTYFLKEIPIYPMSIANVLGDSMILTKAVSDDRAEAITRALAVASYNAVGVVDHPNKWGVLKEGLIHNTISMCLDIGQVARKAQENNENIAYAVTEANDGYIIFEGTVSDADWEDKDGFTYGNIYIQGEGEYQSEELHIWLQNENIMSWKNGEVYVTVPDSINIVDVKNNMPLLNPNADVGMKVTVFALKAFKEWRTEAGIELLGPKFFGYDYDYKRVEDIL